MSVDWIAIEKLTDEVNCSDNFAGYERCTVERVGADALLRAALKRLQLPPPDREFILRCMLDAACEEVEARAANVPDQP